MYYFPGKRAHIELKIVHVREGERLYPCNDQQVIPFSMATV